MRALTDAQTHRTKSRTTEAARLASADTRNSIISTTSFLESEGAGLGLGPAQTTFQVAWAGPNSF